MQPLAFASLSNEILKEYEEILSQKLSPLAASYVSDVIMRLPNLRLVHPTFRFHIIHKDPDDNKFVDCAIIGQATFIVSNDKHFEEAKRCKFPKVNVLTLSEFAASLMEK